MPITGIKWDVDEGYDIHLMRGNHRLDLRSGLLFILPDGTEQPARVYMDPILNPAQDVILEFRPSFDATLDMTVDPPISSGFGIRINDFTGQIDVDAPPTPAPVIHNFILNVIATDSTDNKQHTTSIRVHLHNRVTSAWLTPSVLTLRPQGGDFPQETNVRFSVRAQFDDNTIGDITHHPNIGWRPASQVTPEGFLIINAVDSPANPAVQIDAVLPPDLEDFLSPTPTEIRATGHIRFAVDWAADSTIRTETVQIQNTWPGTVNPEVVFNFLYICDGYKPENKPQFEAQVRGLIGLMKTSQITRPFDLLSTSMNHFSAFVPSAHHGISVLSEVYPEQDSDGNIDPDADGTIKFYGVPDPDSPPATGNWDVANLIYRIGLPVPAQGLGVMGVPAVRDYWDSIALDIPRPRIPDSVVRRWQKMSKRTLLEENDSVFGLAYGDYPSSQKSNNNEIGFHPRRMIRSRTAAAADTHTNQQNLDPILRRLVHVDGVSIGNIWARRPDGTRPNSFRLIFILSSLRWDRGVNFSRGYIAMNVEDRYWIPARSITGKPTFQIDLTGKITNSISHGRLIRGCHEVGHSFGLGDEYNETGKGSMPQADEVNAHYGNLQKHSEIEDTVTHRLDGDKIKWCWHRIRKAAEISGAITQEGPVADGKFRIPLVISQSRQFAVGNIVLLRVRTVSPFRPLPLPADLLVSNQLEILEVIANIGVTPPETAIIVRATAGNTFAAADAALFPAGCIVYLPVTAKDSVRSASYPFAEMIAKNIKDHITARNRALNQDPANADFCVADPNPIQEPVKLTVDLPFCLKKKNRIVGLFTGGRLYECGIYHPTGSCIMRNSNESGTEFCAVCRYIMVDIIDPYKHFSINLDYEEIYPQT